VRAVHLVICLSFISRLRSANVPMLLAPPDCSHSTLSRSLLPHLTVTSISPLQSLGSSRNNAQFGQQSFCSRLMLPPLHILCFLVVLHSPQHLHLDAHSLVSLLHTLCTLGKHDSSSVTTIFRRVYIFHLKALSVARHNLINTSLSFQIVEIQICFRTELSLKPLM